MASLSRELREEASFPFTATVARETGGEGIVNDLAVFISCAQVLRPS